MQFGYECFQFIQREMLFQSLYTPERLVRKSDLLRKFDVGQLTPFFTHEDCQLLVEITSHRPKMANNPPRMCGDMKILPKKIHASAWRPPRLGGCALAVKSDESNLRLVGENIFQPEIQIYQHLFQRVQS
jgi:hypothetical protein